MSDPKVLIWDLELSDLELKVNAYGLKNYTRYFDPKTLQRDYTLLGAAWKWLGDDASLSCMSVSPDDPFNDYGIVKHMHKTLSDADVLVGHNSDRFDLKKFNTRAVLHGFCPLPQKKTVDTLKVAKKYFSFTSNKLSYLLEYFDSPFPKGEPPDWRKVMDGDPDELRYMRKYNKIDVQGTEWLYNKLKSWHHTHPNLNVFREGVHHYTCPTCGSHDVVKRGMVHNKASKHQRYSCNSCGAWSQSKKSMTVENLK